MIKLIKVFEEKKKSVNYLERRNRLPKFVRITRGPRIIVPAWADEMPCEKADVYSETKNGRKNVRNGLPEKSRTRFSVVYAWTIARARTEQPGRVRRFSSNLIAATYNNYCYDKTWPTSSRPANLSRQCVNGRVNNINHAVA